MRHPDSLIGLGGPVKALGDGRVGGPLVLFSDAAATDLDGEYFTRATDFRIRADRRPLLLYEHAMDAEIGDREIGSVEVKSVDEVGVWVEAQLAMRDAYERAVYDLAAAGKLGWSSGTADHLLRKCRVGKAVRIDAWPLVEASLTTHPAEPRCGAVPLKSWIAGTLGADAAPAFGAMTDELVAGLSEFKGLAARFRDARVKAGRVLSEKNRGRIRGVCEAMGPLMTELQALLDEADAMPPDGPDAGPKAARLAALAEALSAHRRYGHQLTPR